MRVSVISFTKKGKDTSIKLADSSFSSDKEILLFSKCSSCSFTDNDDELKKDAKNPDCDAANKDVEDADCAVTDKEVEYGDCDYKISHVSDSVSEWAGKRFDEDDVLIFVGAVGIAVRAVVPSIKDKLTDIPVIVIDEKGKYVIPILSGHAGGANALAKDIAKALNAEAVITTATDLNDKFAVDVFALNNHLFIENKDGIKAVSSKVLSGEKITLCVQKNRIKNTNVIPEELETVDFPADRKTNILISSDEGNYNADLLLRPREYILGIGCKKGKSYEEVLSFLDDCLKDLSLEYKDLCSIASIDLKKDEDALIKLSHYLRIPYKTYSAETLNNVKGNFSSSDFVKEVTGTDNICERAAAAAAGEMDENWSLAMEKRSKDGITMALVKRDWMIKFYE